ncbi:MAG: hypothetical protein M0Z30_03340 [Actinomycetota bacterium]|nr:hypothetical protein [Actinomycetota bacterium]
MELEQPYDQLGGSRAPAGRPARRVPKVAVAVGLTAFLGLGGAGVALALDGGGNAPSAALSASSSTSSTTVAKGALRPHMRVGWGGPMGFGGSVVHGQYTVKNGSSYQTIDVQVGQVTSVSSSSITVLSADGFSQTYTVQPSTVVDSQSGGISAVALEDTVHVEGIAKGKGHTATDIIDSTKIGSSRKGFGLGVGLGRGPRGGMRGAPFPPSPPTGSPTA